MLKRTKNVSYLVDKDTCKQFQKQNRQRTTLCLAIHEELKQN